MLSRIAGVALLPVNMYRDVRRGVQEIRDVTAALNHFADESVELPDNLLDMLRWKA